MQKNSVSLKEVLTRMYERMSAVFAGDTPPHWRDDADNARKRCIGECQYRSKHYN